MNFQKGECGVKYDEMIERLPEYIHFFKASLLTLVVHLCLTLVPSRPGIKKNFMCINF